jgi:hypothetical protein
MLDFGAELTSKSLIETYNGRLLVHAESGNYHRLELLELHLQHREIKIELSDIQPGTTNAPRVGQRNHLTRRQENGSAGLKSRKCLRCLKIPKFSPCRLQSSPILPAKPPWSKGSSSCALCSHQNSSISYLSDGV